MNHPTFQKKINKFQPTINNKMVPKICMVIIDGWGHNEEPKDGDAIEDSPCPWMRLLSSKFRSYLLKAHGEAVGLPHGQMGNSEVGHLTLGSGRVIEQDIVRINRIISEERMGEQMDSVDFRNPTGTLHIIGLLSDGGVHSHINHIKSILRNSKNRFAEAFVHCIADGRDTSPKSFLSYYEDLTNFLKELEFGNIATVAGRYYAMDRDNRHDRTELAFTTYTQGQPITNTIKQEIQHKYDNQETDEFFTPFLINKRGRIKNSDFILFANFRADRMRQIVQRFISNKNRIFTLTSYSGDFKVPVLFPPVSVHNTLAEVISQNRISQVHIAETEKYAHVTYFFNGGRELPFPLERRILVASPQVPYHQQPEMSLFKVVEEAYKEIKHSTEFILVNFAAPDMIGHTGRYKETTEAIKATDECIGLIYEACVENGYILVVTADHGNAEIMKDEKGMPVTKHTCNKVPLIICDREAKGKISWGFIEGDYCLKDVAPTVLRIMGIEKPKEMTGKYIY